MKNKNKIILFSSVLFGLSIFNIASKDRVFSNLENRVLMQKPEINSNNILSSELRDNFETYTNDQFIFRDQWVSLKTLSDLAFGKKDNGRVYFGKDGFLFDVEASLDETQVDKNMASILSFNEGLENKLPITAILVPNKSSIYPQFVPKFAPIDMEASLMKEKIDRINTFINIRYPFEAYASIEESLLYYKTDHHWTADGAYIAYKDLVQNKAVLYEDFNIDTVSTNFYGSNYRKANSTYIKPDSINSVIDVDDYIESILIDDTQELNSYYAPAYLNKTDQYSYFLGGDYGKVDITTTFKNGQRIIIFKDSFANAFVPYLTRNFEKITMIDLRYFNSSIKDLNLQNNYDQVLFLYNIQTFAQDKNLSKINK